MILWVVFMIKRRFRQTSLCHVTSFKNSTLKSSGMPPRNILMEARLKLNVHDIHMKIWTSYELLFIWSQVQYPANICWSSRRLQDVFSITIFRLPRRLEDISQEVLRTSWKTKNCYAENVLKTSWRHVLKTSSRHVLKIPWKRLGDKQMFTWGYVFNHGLPANLNQYLTNLYLINLYFTNLRRIRNALIRTQ